MATKTLSGIVRKASAKATPATDTGVALNAGIQSVILATLESDAPNIADTSAFVAFVRRFRAETTAEDRVAAFDVGTAFDISRDAIVAAAFLGYATAGILPGAYVVKSTETRTARARGEKADSATYVVPMVERMEGN